MSSTSGNRSDRFSRSAVLRKGRLNQVVGRLRKSKDPAAPAGAPDQPLRRWTPTMTVDPKGQVTGGGGLIPENWSILS